MDWCLVGLAADFSWFDAGSWWAIAQVVIGLGFVIFVHELGHFLVAKACGVKCEKFYVGFDFFDIKIGDRVIVPRSLVNWRWGETEYGIGIIPLGGYVKMLGQDDNPGNVEKEAQRSRVDGNTNAPIAGAEGPLDRTKLDPRSFLAKSVPQRMAIISAGVVFNLIFAVIFAAFAFRYGVSYMPAVVGDTIPGGPAWVANFPEATITRVGEKPLDSGYVPYIDMVQEIALQGGTGPLEIEFVRDNQTTPETVSLVPQKGLIRDLDIGLLGLEPKSTMKLSDETATLMTQSAADASPSFQPKDTLVSVNGKPVESIGQFKRAIIPEFDRPIVVGVLRDGASQPTSITVPPNPARELGFIFGWGPVAAVQIGSPAERAGIKIGDRILSVDGQKPGDLLSFDQRMVQQLRAGKKSIELEVKTTAADSTNPKTENKQLDIRMPERTSEPEYGPTALESIGVAISFEPIVAQVNAASQAATSGVTAGDKLTYCSFQIPEKYADEKIFKDGIKKFPIGIARKSLSIGEFHAQVQGLPVGTVFDLNFERADGSFNTAKVTSVQSTGSFRVTRGVIPTALERVYRTDDWAEAFQLGARQTWQDGTRIWRFLKKLVKGEISATNLGGPGTIAMVATSEASKGTARLLLFLTMLSANLAIVNFLPIPVLDGGHMMFLAYEGIFRRPVTERVQVVLLYAGLLFIFGLMLFVIMLDIGRISQLY